jgi:prevent-host-death family protein
MQINILEAKNQLSQLIRYAQAGDEVIIANRGQPVAQLIAAKPAPEQANGKTFLDWLKENPLPAHAQRSAQEIDAGIEEERSAWD